jgi:hypothetical protein
LVLVVLMVVEVAEFPEKLLPLPGYLTSAANIQAHCGLTTHSDQFEAKAIAGQPWGAAEGATVRFGESAEV